MKRANVAAVFVSIATALTGCSSEAPFDVHVVENPFGATSKMLEFWAKTDGIEITRIVANDGSCDGDPVYGGYPIKLTAQQPKRTGTGCPLISEISVETNQGTYEFSFDTEGQ